MLVGAVLVALGVVFLLGQLNVVDAGRVIGACWPAITVAAGVLQLVVAPGRLPRGLVAIVIGCGAAGEGDGPVGGVAVKDKHPAD